MFFVRNCWVINAVVVLFAVSAGAQCDKHQDKNVSSLGDGTCVYRYYNSAHFIIGGDLQAAEAERIAESLEQSYTAFLHFMEKSGFKPDRQAERLNWFCFGSSENFKAYINRTEGINLPCVSSYYSAKTNSAAILMPALEGVKDKTGCDANSAGNIMADAGYRQENDRVRMGHELAHQLAFNTGIQKRGVMYPLWVSEGLATVFEMQVDCNNCRQIAENNRGGKLIDLAEFITMTKMPADYEFAPAVYGQAQAFFNFLLACHGDKLRTYMDNLYKQKSGRRLKADMLAEFTDVFGPVKAIEDEWISYVSGSVVLSNRN